MQLAFDSAKIDAVLAPYESSHKPGLVLGVAQHGRALYRRGVGLASVELPVALSPHMRLRIGSVSKHFCCLCIMLLAEEGKLSPHDTVRRHLPELPAWADERTLLDLMGHTSGIRCSLDVLSLTADIMTRPLAGERQLELLQAVQSVNFPPRETFLYCNGGYVLLTEIVRRVSGVTFEDFLQQRVLAPVGMHDTLARPVDTTCIPNAASLHLLDAEGRYRRGVFGPAMGGEGSMASTVDDMLLWLKHMSAPCIGTAATWRAMVTPQTLRSGVSTGYGLGLIVGAYRGLDILYHTGHVVGGNCQMLKAPSLGLDIVAMTNVSNIDAKIVVEQVLDACVEGLERDVPCSAGDLPLGHFLSPRTGRHLHIVRGLDGLALQFGAAQISLKPMPDGSFWLPANMKDGATLLGDGAGVVWREFGASERLDPLAPPNGETDASPPGSYICSDLNVRAVIFNESSQRICFGSANGAADYALQHVARDFWLITGPNGEWIGHLEKAGSDILLSSLRTRRLRFTPA